MTPNHHDSEDFIQNLREETIREFTHITNTIVNIVGSKPFESYSAINWVQVPLELSGPRFGAREYYDAKSRLILDLSLNLVKQFNKYRKLVLWREAFLLHLPSVIRQIPEAADLGLYCYYRYGIKTQQQRNRFLQLWETISPPQDFVFYRYYPTAGFAFFDNVVDGTFLKKAIEWFKPFNQLTEQMTTEAYTGNLERLMFNHHRKLKPIELKVLRGLNDCLSCSQTELAKNLGLRQPTVSRIIRELSEKHLLRFVTFANYPIIGLQPVTVKFTSPKLKVIDSLKQLIARIRYTLGLQEFETDLLSSFVIPSERMTRFRQWLKQLASIYEIKLPKVRSITERIHARNFGLYDPKKGGWPLDYESILDNFFRLITEELTRHLPPLRFYKLTPMHLKETLPLQHQDFIYMQRVSDTYIATSQMKFLESQEAIQAGYKESEHMAYRRRVDYLEEHKLVSPPIGVGLIHIGLNAAIYILLESSSEETHQILTACQLFPHVAGRIFDDGSGIATIFVPSASAVAIQASLYEVFNSIEIPITLAIKPSWEAFGWTGPRPLNSANYDFQKSKWIWTKDSLPLPRF